MCVRVCTPLMCVITYNDYEMPGYQPKHDTQPAPSLRLCVFTVDVCVLGGRCVTLSLSFGSFAEPADLLMFLSQKEKTKQKLKLKQAHQYI